MYPDVSKYIGCVQIYVNVLRCIGLDLGLFGFFGMFWIYLYIVGYYRMFYSVIGCIRLLLDVFGYISLLSDVFECICCFRLYLAVLNLDVFWICSNSLKSHQETGRPNTKL